MTKATLSVVVPVYNVVDYLRECLDSLRMQSLEGIEIVLVDDGSTDGSRELAQELISEDSRFRLIEASHGGLGRARNIGAAECQKTKYLAFADSDDWVVPGAYLKMVSLLESSGSDFVTGNVQRLIGTELSQAWQYEQVTETRTGVHITRDLSLLTDRVAWNKVFRRSFWDEHTLSFPESMLYEDSPVMIPAHFLATSVDVLHEHVYVWRARSGSISQRRTEIPGVVDRIAGCRSISDFLSSAQRGRWAEFKAIYDRSVLMDDLADFLEILPVADAAFHATFIEEMKQFIDSFHPETLTSLPEDLRLKWNLVQQGHLQELLKILPKTSVATFL
ncbi:glycosyltransferase [Streptomyces coacervatus]|uniref:Glycosyltransferase n=1 Tax=Streptomyces coacervatus TaxID=647381 RepID=A0ABP7HKI3_9ACTN|nr:glycosyltransferase family 2 protein [Streptomyces coacervatus]MDF2272069.1 glycosyltransferase family 2 protein [Streptomyces coacervatus]